MCTKPHKEMNINEIKSEIAAELGLRLEDLDWVTEEELRAYGGADDEPVDKTDAEGQEVTDINMMRSGVYRLPSL